MSYAPHETSGSWPIKAYKNLEFLNSAAARQIRIQCEMEEPEHRLRQLGVENTIVFFGSARIPDTETARTHLEDARRDVEEGKPGDPALSQRLRVAERQARCAPYHDRARDLARELTQWSLTIPEKHKRFHICSGAGPGMMEAANHGAHLAGGESLGLGISLPFEPVQNSYITEELKFEFHYFFVRKYWFFYLAKALVVTPGGFGTMDEFFEILTLIQTRKTVKKLPIVLLGSEFWNDIINFQAFVDWGVISDEDLHLFRIMDDVGEARDYIISELTNRYLTKQED